MPGARWRGLLRFFLPAWGALLCSQVLSAAKEDKGTVWSGDVGIGLEWDSNVSVEELDAASNKGDYAMVLDGGIGVSRDFENRVGVDLTYDYSATLYKQYNQVDQQTHILGLNTGMDFKTVDPGFSLYYINARLDNHQFLDMYRASPALSGFISKKWFARGAYVYQDKSIHERPGRDARTNALEGDLYYFWRGLRSYFNLGYRYRDEDAKANQYTYHSNGVKLRYIQRIELFSRLTKLELAGRYERRRYQADTPGIGEKRDDDRYRWRIDYEIPVFDSSVVQFYLGYADYQSNYDPAAYDQTLVGARFSYRW